MINSCVSFDEQDYKPTVVDLFSGAGGTGLGFVEAGFRIVGAIEIDASAAETYERNLKVKVKRIDIRQLSPKTFREEIGLQQGELDLLVGCPPCQGFSRMRNTKGVNDERNSLVLRYLEYLEEFLPRYAVFENVPGLIRTQHGQDFYKQLLEGLEKLGYRYIEHLEDLVNFGVPQHRKRVIVIGGRNGEIPVFPDPTHSKQETLFRQKWITVQEAIGNNKYPSLKAGEDGQQEGKYPNHVAPTISERVLDFIRMVPNDGGSRKEVPQCYWLKCHISHNGHGDVYGRLAWNKPAITITAGCTSLSKGRFVHPDQDRALTAREAATLQGFPDNYIFYNGNFASQIGNAVPPPLARAIGKQLRTKILESKSPNDGSNALS